MCRSGVLVIIAGVATKDQAAKLVKHLERWLEKAKYGVPSLDPEDPRFEELRYWRGPVWIIINWMISNGLRHYGYKSNFYETLLSQHYFPQQTP